MNKYIIKNCPAYCYLGEECHNEEDRYGSSCCEVTDCVVKQIVELCSFNYTKGNTNLLAKEILKLLDIQEVE